MCFNQPISGFFAACSLGIAYFANQKLGRRSAYCALYFGAMETLQFLQYFVVARPEDDYAQCANPTNQFLTVIGFLHVCFQPFFLNWGACRFRYNSLRTRHEQDLVAKITFIGGCWLFSRYLYTALYPDNPDMRPRPTEDCPNYEYLAAGFDPWLKQDTPEVPGHSCTFIPRSSTGHLGWTTPIYQPTYFVPGCSVHTFLMFVPGALTGKVWPTVMLFLTGPVLAAFLTASLHEQPAVWCYFSIAQNLLQVLYSPNLSDKIEKRLFYKGTWGEPDMHYELVETKANGTSNGFANGHSNGHANGKKSN